MPKPPLRRRSFAHWPLTLLRHLPRQRARQWIRPLLDKFHLETLPSLKHRTQSRIYRYILYRQARKLKRKPGILQRLRGHTRQLLGTNYLENEVRVRRRKLTHGLDASRSGKKAMSYQDSYAQREPGARRKKLAGYLKAANELRQSYQQQYAQGWNRRDMTYDYEDDTPGAFPDAAVVRSGEEEMILFPSYARKHVKRKPEAVPGAIQEAPGDGRDVRDSSGAGDAEFWKQQWDNYEDDNAVVDVDVRGWIYSPHKGQMSRKQRVSLGIVRHLVGIQAPPAGAKTGSASPSPLGSRDPSPGQLSHHERSQVRQSQRDELLTAKEAEEILRRGEKEAEMAAKGAYSEKPAPGGDDNTKLYRTESRDSVRTQESRGNVRTHQLSHAASNSSMRSEDNITPLQKRASWNQPADMSAAELAEANGRLLARVRHFLAIPMANTPISVFFYNNEISKQRTVYTNPSGHFSITAALDFVPTHVRILASESLSATEEIIITESQGISVLSDIDDTIKHSAISSGAREIFRSAFIRDLGDLTIDGVKEWYNRMAEMGVKFHYVSNSPWQLYPVISKYFSIAGLPPGSFHLKQYSGMLQGIFEPVAERKKGTLDKIARDFPERNFILIGDSGEADLEVYTDFVLENPGRVVAIFIRDVTTTEETGFFDSSFGSNPAPQRHGGGRNGGVSNPSRLANSSSSEGSDDPELRAAIAASLRDMDEDDRKRSKSLFPPVPEDHPNLRPSLPPRRSTQAMANLIDLDEVPVERPTIRRVNTDSNADADTDGHRGSIASTSSTKSAPPPPRKPVALRSASGESPAPSPSTSKAAPPPPKPRHLSSSVHQASPLSQQTSTSNPPPKPPVGPKPTLSSQQTYASMARDKLSSVYNNLPSASSYLQPAPSSQESPAQSVQDIRKPAPPPPPPPRRGITTYPVAAASYVGSKANSAWQNAPNMPHPSLPHRNPAPQNQQPFSTTAAVGAQRTNTGSSLGMNGANGGQGGDGAQYVNKREQLWRQRWARAEQVLGDKGVVLRSWRVGGDVVGEAERLIREVGERQKRNGSGNGNGNMR